MSVEQLVAAAGKELTEDILPFWEKYGRDVATGGFYASLGNDNVGDPAGSRSVVMTSRHLWAYSAAAKTLKNPSLLAMADYAWNALTKNFIDPVHGGVFWSVRPDGSPDVSKKQIYGEAFALYALSEYASALHEIRGDRPGAEAAILQALSIYELLEKNARERTYGGYVEARARDWKPTSDLKLSEKDIDCAKSMNTNLHVLEALSSLLRALRAVRPSAPVIQSRVAESLSSLIVVTVDRILGKDGHLDLYFNDDWSSIRDVVSYGHDIETSWLLWEALETLDDPALSRALKSVVIRIAEVALAEGADPETGAMENEFHGGKKDRTRVWWCQAEALVGFCNAWQLTGDEKFLAAAEAQWKWIETRQIDRKNGDWFASVAPDGTPDLREAKGGNWKTSYHNGRCCMEMLNRFSRTKGDK
jgi:cellobiose epimerase